MSSEEHFLCFFICSCGGLAELFRVMFRDSAIAQTFTLQNDKCSYFINHGIASLKDFLTSYQQVKPMAPFLHDDFHQLFRDIVAKFIKPNVLDQCKNSKQLCEIDLNNPNNHFKKPDIGYGSNNKISAKVKSDEITLVDCKKFHLDCITLLKTMASKLIEKSPLKFAVVRNARCLNPTVICLYPNNPKKAFSMFGGKSHSTTLSDSQRWRHYVYRIKALPYFL